MPELESLVDEAQRQFTICNACRYCEDYCAVFPAAERRSLFLSGDLGYLANVCHDCRACYQACMYTDPHEFAINIPALMSEARVASYQEHSRPRWLAGLFERGPLALGLLTSVSIVALVAIQQLTSGADLFEARSGPGSFYEVVSHEAMVIPGLLISIWAVAILGGGFLSFWRDSGGTWRQIMNPSLWRQATREAATMRWMRGGGGECHFPEEERPSPVRRRLHGLVMWGFLLTFAATVAAAFMNQVLGQLPPYGWLSAPVLFGFTGGVMILVGGVGLLRLKAKSPPDLIHPGSARMDRTFLVSLLAVTVTGLALLFLRDTAAMGALLLVHLATVLVLFVTAPYGKMVHGVYRIAAILKSCHERDLEQRG